MNLTAYLSTHLSLATCAERCVWHNQNLRGVAQWRRREPVKKHKEQMERKEGG